MASENPKADLLVNENMLNSYHGGIKNIFTNKDDIANIESSTTSSNAYVTGNLLYLNGVLYKVLSDIDEGDTIVTTGENKNVEETSVSDVLQTSENGVGKNLEGKTVKPTSETEVIAGSNSEIFNDYRDRTFNNETGSVTAGNIASGAYSHAEGQNTTSSGASSHAEGYLTNATGECSHAEGTGVTAAYPNQHTQGKYNNNKSDTLFEIGNGTSKSNKSNAFEVTSDGYIRTKGRSDKIAFGVDENGNYGYIKAGADTVIPFKKDPNLQSKSVTPSSSSQTVTPDSGYDGLSQVSVSAVPTQTKSVTPSTSSQTVTPDTGKFLSSVSVGAISTQTKSVTPSTSSQTVTPDSGKYLSSVSVGAISTQSKTATPSTSSQTIYPDSGKYLSGVTINPISTQTKTASLSGNQQTITPDSGKYLTGVTVPAVYGSATPNQVLSGYGFASGSYPSGTTGNIPTRTASNYEMSTTETKTYYAGYYPNNWNVTVYQEVVFLEDNPFYITTLGTSNFVEFYTSYGYAIIMNNTISNCRARLQVLQNSSTITPDFYSEANSIGITIATIEPTNNIRTLQFKTVSSTLNCIIIELYPHNSGRFDRHYPTIIEDEVEISF